MLDGEPEFLAHADAVAVAEIVQVLQFADGYAVFLSDSGEGLPAAHDVVAVASLAREALVSGYGGECFAHGLR